MTDEINNPDNIDEDKILSAVKYNLKQFRTTRNFSLDKLASLSGVSRAMLSQIEQGKSIPTISVLWKIANGLGVTLYDLLKVKEKSSVHLLRYESTKVLYSSSKVFSSRALFPFLGARKTEFYEMSIKPGGIEVADPHQAGTRENIVVVEGRLRLTVGNNEYELEPGDSIYFDADVLHEYCNPADTETRMFLVMDFKNEVF